MTEKMDPHWKKKWVDALRSGEYLQGKGCLRRRTSYCCLGVLTDLAIREGAVKGDWRPFGMGGGYESGDDYPEVTASALPLEVQVATGVVGEYPRAGEWTLAAWNDTGSTFPEIADLIEEYL